MRAYEAIIDDGQDVFKVTRCAESEEAFRDLYGGNGEIVRIKDITDETPIGLGRLEQVLVAGGFGRQETAIILSTMRETYPNLL